MKLSILIPSKRQEGLDRFVDSLEKNTANKSDIELVILLDDDKNYVSYLQYGSFKVVEIHRIPDDVLNISKLQYECYKLASGDWIMLGNDDCLIETENWDNQIFYGMGIIKDEISLVYPNDGMFGKDLACFPVFSRKFADLVNLFPMPYFRYKVDDTILSLFPQNRRIYVQTCKFTHLNDKGVDGYKLPDGRIYPIDRVAGDKDQVLWESEAPRRAQMTMLIDKITGNTTKRVLIGIPTVEMARRAVFYDYLGLLQRPEGSIQTACHGQSPAASRNLIIEQALANNCSHVLFIDDDMAFPPDALLKLLAHDKDMVTGFYLMRNYPHQPLLFNKRAIDNSVFPYYPEVGKQGLVKILNTGLGFCLIKTEVFRKMPKPWITLGEYDKANWCDDISFFNRASDLGFELWVDMDCPIGHMASVTIRPIFQNGDWVVSYETDGAGTIGFPLFRPTAETEVEKKELVAG